MKHKAKLVKLVADSIASLNSIIIITIIIIYKILRPINLSYCGFLRHNIEHPYRY